MANIMDYLDWRGDLAIAVDGFCEVDNLLLAQLVYVDFEGIVPAPEAGGYITLEDASETFWSSHDEEEILQKVSMTKSAPFVLKKMAQTRRFAGVRLSHYTMISVMENSPSFRRCAWNWRTAAFMSPTAGPTTPSLGGERILIWDF